MKYGLIGEKLTHSFSPEIHQKLGDYPYELVELKKEEVGTFMTEKDFSAINVTIPYKKDVIPYLDEISEEAKKIGAVNTVVNRNGRLYGYNTDYIGMSRLIMRITDGKKLSGTDEGIFTSAEKLVKEEFAFSLQIEGEKVAEYIQNYFEG